MGIDLFEIKENEDKFSHSQRLDDLHGINSLHIEKQLSKKFKPYNNISSDKRESYGDAHTWIGLDPQTLQTPYSEIFDFLKICLRFKIKSIVDIGAGYGRMAIVLRALSKNITFYGYEYVSERVEEGNKAFKKLGLDNCVLYHQDVFEDGFVLPESDIYFIYDFGSPSDIKKLLQIFSNKIDKSNFFLVARGNATRSMIQNKFPEFWSAFGVIHGDTWSIYSSFTDLDNFDI